MPIDMSQATVKAPPRKRTGTGPSKAVPPAASSTPTTQASATQMAREEGLNGLGQLGQAICLMTGQRADAAAFEMHWGGISHESAKLAELHDEFAKPIDFLIQIGPYTAFVMALLPFGLQIAANHKWIDQANVSGLGVVSPDVLDAQVKAQMAQLQAESMRQKQAQIAEAQRAQAMYEQQIRNAQNDMASMQTMVVSSELA